jgi:RNA polymerase sigma factor for flagellar operon FliA
MYTAAGTLEKEKKTSYLERFTPLVRRIAHHMIARLPPNVQLEDIVQAGMIGLMDAVSRYEEEQGVQFETYAVQRIRGAILDELRQNDWLPRGTRKAQRRVDAAVAKMEQRLGRSPTERELAEHLELSLEQYQALLLDAYGYQVLFYDNYTDEDGESDFLERNAPADRADPLSRLSDARFKKALVKALDDLPEREKNLMGLYYEQELNFKEIAAVFGVTESRICQLHAQAASRLRAKLKDW